VAGMASRAGCIASVGRLACHPGGALAERSRTGLL